MSTTAPPTDTGGTGAGARAPSAEGTAKSAAVPAPRRHRVRLLLVLAVLAAAITFLLVEGLGSSLDYFETVHQALTQRTMLGTRSFRLEGLVVPGTVARTPLGADFTLSQGPSRIRVVNTGTPPELFAADIPVVVDGHFASSASTLFLSDQIEVRHSSTYIAAHPGRVRAPNGTVR